MKLGLVTMLAASLLTATGVLAAPSAAQAFGSWTRPAHPVRHIDGARWRVVDLRAGFSNRRLHSITLRCSVRTWFEEYRPVWTWNDTIEAFEFTNAKRVYVRKWSTGGFTVRIPAAHYVYYWDQYGLLPRKLIPGRARHDIDGWRFRHLLSATTYPTGWYDDQYGEFPWRYASDNGYIADEIGNSYEVGTEFSWPNIWEGTAFQPSAPTGPLATDCIRL